MLNRSFPDWKQAFKQIVANPDQQVLAEILSRFDPLRAAIEEDQNLERALQEFLRVVPTNKDVN
jgi:restriction endonuclease S subunit